MKVKNINNISIKGNLIFNFLRVFSTAFIVIFTMPYINRTLGAANVGKVEYVFTILYYFILFSSLGIPIYGIREVSKTRENPKKLHNLVVELMLILSVTTIIAYILLFGILINIPFFEPYKELIFIMCAMILLNNISAEWYFQGIENQKFITVRNVIVKFIVFGLIFICIKQESDFKLYAVFVVILWFGANVVGFFVIIRKMFEYSISFKKLNIKRHFKPIFSIFVTTVSLSIYFQMAFFFIGSISGDKYVAYYLTANSLIRSVVTFISVIGSVMLPRLSYLYGNDKGKYDNYLRKTFVFMMLLALPCTSYFFIFSDQIILLMGGDQFIAASLTMKILSPLCIVASFAYFFGLLVLYPQGKEDIYTKATVISAVFSIILYIVFVRLFQQNGAAGVVVISELIAVLYMGYYIKSNKIVDHILDNNFYKVVLVNVFLFIVFYFGSSFIELSNMYLWISISLTYGLVYGIFLLLSKEKNSSELLSIVLTKLRNRN